MRHQNWTRTLLLAGILLLVAAGAVTAGSNALSSGVGPLRTLLATSSFDGLRFAQSTPVATSSAVTVAGGKIVFMSRRDGNEEIYIMNPDGTEQTRLTNNAAVDRMPCISPDGNKVLFSTSRHGNGEIYEMNLDGTGLIRLTNDGSDDLQPVYSPDGSQIAFSSNRAGGDYDVFIMNRDGSNVRRLTFNQLGDYDASWKPDGSQLSFATFYGYNYQAEVTRINLNGTGQVRLTDSPGGNSAQHWGANDKIIFKSGRDGNPEIYVIDPDGSNITRVTNNTFNDDQPVWSPDTQHIAFTSTRDGNAEIYVMNADGSSQTRLTTNTTEDGTPYWGPPAGTVVPTFITINDSTVTEGNSGTTAATVTVKLSVASPNPVTVAYATAAGTATADTDFTTSSGTVTFPANTTTQTITVPIVGDTLSEGDETFLINLSDASGAQISDTQAQVTINDDDPLPTLSVNNVAVPEGDFDTTSALFTVSLSAPSGRTVMANYQVQSGTAQSGSDFQASSGTITFAPGEETKDVAVTIIGDTRNEDNETFSVRLTGASGALISTAPVLNPANNHYYEAVSASLTWDQARDAAAARTFLGVSGHLVTITSVEEQNFLNTTFGSGTTSWAGGIQPAGSSEPSGGWTWVTGEPFVYTFWNSGEPNNANNGEDALQLTTGGRWNDVSRTQTMPRYIVEYDFSSPPEALAPQGIGTIIDDDAMPYLNISNATMAREGSSGLLNLNFTVTLSAASGRNITVDYATANGTAVAPDDFIATSGTRTINAGSTSTIISVPIVGDTLVEADIETFSLSLSNAVNATIENGYATGTITDDDGEQVLSINNVSVNEGNSGTTSANFTVTLSASSTRTVRVDYTTVPIAPTTTNDFQSKSGTLEFAAGQTTAAISVLVNGDNMDEADEYFFIRLTNPVNAVTANAPTDPANPNSQGIGTIIDDDATPGISINDVTKTEGSGGTSDAVFTVALTAASGRNITVEYSTGDVTATQPDDYSARSGTLLIPAGVASANIRVPVVGDFVVEPDELFIVTLINATNVVLGRNQGIGTIVNDDNAPAECTDSPSGLVSWWTGDDTATDMIGGNHGTLRNGATYANGRVGRAFSFDGVDDRISVPDSPAFALTKSLTIEGWIRWNSVSGQAIEGYIFFRGDDRAGLDPYSLALLNNGNAQFKIWNASTQVTVAAPVPAGSWTHVAGVLDDATNSMSLYVNGALAAQTTTSVRPFAALDAALNPGIGIGNTQQTSSYNHPFPGQIDEVSLYSRALSGSEIQNLFTAAESGKCRPATTPTPLPSPTPTTPPITATIQQVALPTNDIVYDKVSRKIYASVPSSAGEPRANSVTPIDPFSATIGNSINVGFNPTRVVVTDDGSYVYTSIIDATSIRRVDLATQTATLQFGLGNDYSPLFAEDMETVPGHPRRLAVSRANRGISPRLERVVIYEDNVVKPATVRGANVIEMASATRMYGYLSEVSSFDFVRWNVNDTGIIGGDAIHPISGYGNNIKYDSGRIYTTYGSIFDPETNLQLGSFPGGTFVPDGSVGRIFVLTQSGSTGTITAYSTTSFLAVGSITVPGISGNAGTLIRWGSSGLAFRTTGGQVFLISTNLVAPTPALSLSVTPSSINENGGAATGTLTRSNTGVSTPLTVNLTSSDTTEARVPATVTIPAGATSVNFTVTAVDDSIMDGPQTVTISATASDFVGSQTATVTVRDNEVSSIRGRVLTSDGTGLANIVVTRNNNTTAVTDSNGNYVFINVPFGNYIIAPQITPSLQGVTFTPSSRIIANTTSGLTNINFVAGFSINGRLTNNDGVGLPNVLIRRSTATSSTSIATDSNGNYRFSNVNSGDYTIAPQLTPAMNGTTFSPTARTVSVRIGNLTNINFTAWFSISGRIANNNGVGIPNIQITRRSGGSAVTTATDVNGNYRFGEVRSGTYTLTPSITPSMQGMSFNPGSQTVTVRTQNLTNINFLGFFRITGRVVSSAGTPLANVLVTRSTSTSSTSVLTDANGNYSFTEVRSGTYTITPNLDGTAFSPVSRTVTVEKQNLTNINFLGSPG